MGYEKGGRADKAGNRFEYNWILYNLLQVIEEKIQYVMIEAIGEDEEGVDLWIGNLDGSREGQQCKGRYGSEESWSYGTVNAKGIWKKWKTQLEREGEISVSLVSPLAFIQLEDITGKARNTNDTPKDFYNYQINKDTDSKDTKRLYKNFCSIMEIDCSNEAGLSKSIDYLSRIYYKQMPDFEMKQIVLDKIFIQFVGESSDIYAVLLQLILTEDVWSKRLDVGYLDNYLRSHNVEYKNLARDTRISPQINALNEEYSKSFQPFQKGIMIRHEFEECKNMINIGQSFIVHGNAGTGKSGCTENIIGFCNQEKIPYLAVKLDKRIPKDTTKNWGISMGLPDSPALCIDAVSKESKAVIIFDQLDALRWTQSHSGSALDVCVRTIKEVEILNKSRKNNISIVFVVRTYDLLNDRGIKNLFDMDSEHKKFQWKDIKIGELAEEDIILLTGKEFNALSQKTKKLLAVSSNMYIWQHLNENTARLNINTTRQLVNEWWKQIQLKAGNLNMDSRFLLEISDKIVSFCNAKGRINAPNSVIQIPSDYMDFLLSNGFISIVNEMISFAHQSILDVFLSDFMVREYYLGTSVIVLTGNKEKQTPGRRYQLQLFMEQMVQDSEKDFLNIGKELLSSDAIRFSFKFVFLEILANNNMPSKIICKFVCQMANDIEWGKYFLDNVIVGNDKYISAMQEDGTIEAWLNSDNKKIAIRLYASITHSLENQHLQIMRKYIFQDENMLDEWNRCFKWKIDEDTDNLFEIRIQFYEKYPRYLDEFLVNKEIFKKCEMRTIRLLALMLKENLKKNGKKVYRFEEEFIFEGTEVIVNEYRAIIQTLLPYLPEGKNADYGNWSAKYSYHRGLERACIQILKRANVSMINIMPEEFWNIYKKYMLTGNDLYNEIILDGLYRLPQEYADKIIEYLCEDFNLTMFEETSGSFDRLHSGKVLLKKVSLECSKEHYQLLEKSIIKFVDKDAIRTLKNRIDFNKQRETRVYWRFWGDFQRECLKVLSKERMSVETQQLLRMFSRCEENYHSVYKYSGIQSGRVTSPIEKKDISYKAWKGILTNANIPVHNLRCSKMRDGTFIEATQREFAVSLGNFIKKEGEPFLEYMLNIDLPISDTFVQSIYSAITLCERPDMIKVATIEKLVEKFGYDYEDFRAKYIVHIFEKRKNAEWSEKMLSVFFDIALNHKNPEMGKPNVIPQEDKDILLVDSIESNAINSVRSEALEVIAELIWDDEKMAERFSEPIRKAIEDINPVMRYASQFALYPIYNINREWASKQFISLYENDIRMAGFYDGKGILLRLYIDYREKIMDIIDRMFRTEDKRLIKTSGHTIVELYMLHDECCEIVMGEFKFSKEQKEAILEMLIVYFGVEQYKEKAKEALLHNLNDSFDIEFPWTRLFYDKLVDLKRDGEFINLVLKSVVGKRVLGAFIHYIKDTDSDIKQCENIILQICWNLVELGEAGNEVLWLHQSEISKMVISLYDAYSDDFEDAEGIALQCLDLWDAMYEKQIGVARDLTKTMMDV